MESVASVCPGGLREVDRTRPHEHQRVPVTPVFPAVFPIVDIPAENPVRRHRPMMEMCSRRVRGLRERDGAEPTCTIRVPVTPCCPAVFPQVETPTEYWAAPGDGAMMEMVMLPPLVDPRA